MSSSGPGAKALAISTLVFTVVSFLFTQALAAVDEQDLVLSPSNGLPGSSMEISGSGFAEEASIDICWGSACSPQWSATSNPTGRFGLNRPVPSEASPGTYLITACEQNRDVCASDAFTVDAPTTTLAPTTTTLPPLTTTTLVPVTTTLEPIPTTTVAPPPTTEGPSGTIGNDDSGGALDPSSDTSAPAPSADPQGPGGIGPEPRAPASFDPPATTPESRELIPYVVGADVLSFAFSSPGPTYIVPPSPETPAMAEELEVEPTEPEAALVEPASANVSRGIDWIRAILLWLGTMLVVLIVVLIVESFRWSSRSSSN